MANLTMEPTQAATIAGRHLQETLSGQQLAGDFAQGMRTLPVSDERSDYARGLRSLAMELNARPDYARGQHQGAPDPRVLGDFATGQRDLGKPGR